MSVDGSILVIFGASGDLAKLKLLPAIYELAVEKLLPENFALVGYGRTQMSDDQFRDEIKKSIEKNARSAKKDGVDNALLERVMKASYFFAGSYGEAASFDSLKKKLEDLDAQHGTKGNRIFYLSTPPETFEPIVTSLSQQGLARHDGDGEGWQRLIIEKPFGRDLASAKHLNETLASGFAEEQVFRIDHYLGKETVQNLMVLRFANTVFEPIWNSNYIDHVQITVAETVSSDDRAGYYDKSGALRDMVQNHLFQLLALTAMEPPAALDARHIRDEKVKVFQSIRPIKKSQADTFAVRGQYGAGSVGEKTKTEGYKKAKGVAPDSKTETFVALKLFIDNWRWSGTPFYLRTGKLMPGKLSEAVVRFRSPPLTLFQKQCESPVFPNDLVIQVAPNEGIVWKINGKVPGGAMNIKSVSMDFNYNETFKVEAPEAYERLIYDCMLGDQTLFIRGDEAEAAWSVIDPIEQGWAESKDGPAEYKPGTWGPEKAMELIELDGRRWHQDGESPIVACSL